MIQLQTVIVVIVVATSATILVRRALRWLNGESTGCGSCTRGACSENQAATVKLKPLTNIQLPTPKAGTKRS